MENLTWREEFDRRLRRVCGVSDDSLPVQVDGGQSGYCPTCADYDAYIKVLPSEGRRPVATKSFDSFAELLNAVLAVDWSDVHL